MQIDRRNFLLVSGATAGLAAVMPTPAQNVDARLRVGGLEVDHLDRPLGLENLRPRFAWRLESSERGVRQRLYRILVATRADALSTGNADVWDSGKVASRQSFDIEYAGPPLVSRARYWWQVQIWDERDSSHAISATSWWEMGLLQDLDWTAAWLAAEDPGSRADREAGLHWIWGSTERDEKPRQFRYSFSLSAPASAGTLYVGAGTTERVRGIWIDGIEAPLVAPKQYAATRPGLQHIALPPLRKGGHVLAVEIEPSTDGLAKLLGSKAAAMSAFTRLTRVDGSVLRLTSETGWKTHLDAPPGWFAPSYDDRQWDDARRSLEDPGQLWPHTPAVHLRKAFTCDKPVRSARLYATALGLYEARLNGKRVGDALLTPEVSQYRKHVLYQTYDVTTQIRSGANALGLTVGDGWYAGPVTPGGRFPWGPAPRRVFAQLELTFTDGSRQVIPTGAGWRAAQSAIVRADIYDGEIQDARLDQPGWDTPQFDDSRWFAAEAADTPPCRLTARMTPPIRATQALNAQRITQPLPGVYVFDFGQNFAGWCRLRVQGASGTRIELRFAELLTPAGTADQSNLRGAAATDIFILRGDAAAEVFEPKFTYHGFRYVQVAGLPSAPTADTLEGIVVHSDLRATGQLRIDNALIQQIWHNTVWTQRSNVMGVYTDCPQRDERLGWLADASIFWDAAAFNMDIAAFTRRHLNVARDDQAPNGALPALAPGAVPGFSSTDVAWPGWADATIMMVWTSWQHYGDTLVIEENWQAMNRYLQFVQQNNPEYLWKNQRRDLGDWLSVDADRPSAPTTPHELLATVHWARSADLLAQMATAIGRSDDATRLSELHQQIKRAFGSAFVEADGTVGNDSQTGYVLALKWDLVPPALREAAAQRLAENVRRRGVMLTTGIFGTQFILDVLADTGHADLACSLLLRTEYPSWGYMIAQGATTLWERWNSDHGDLSMNSYNHPDFGAVCSFLFRRLAGIGAVAPGFQTIEVRPVLDSRIRRCGGEYDSIMGRISTDISQQTDGGLTLEVTLPANTEALIYLPASKHAVLKEGRRTISRRGDVRLVRRDDKEAVVSVGSGTYRLVVTP